MGESVEFNKDTDVRYVSEEKRWYIRCTVCENEFPFEIVSTDAARLRKNKKEDVPESFTITCTNERRVNESGKVETIVCGTQWVILIDVGKLDEDNEHAVIGRSKSKQSENDKFCLALL